MQSFMDNYFLSYFSNSLEKAKILQLVFEPVKYEILNLYNCLKEHKTHTFFHLFIYKILRQN